MPRPRRAGNRDLPPNLYAKKHSSGVVYYQYRDPRSGNFHGLGTDRAAAVRDATALNAAIYQSIHETRVLRIAAGKPRTSPTLNQWLDEYWLLIEQRKAKGKLSDNTVKNKRTAVKFWSAALGEKPLTEITTLDIAQPLNALRAQGKERMAQSMRSAAIDIWKDAIAEGWATENPAAITRNESVEVKRARLTLEQFQATLAEADTKEPWLGNAMRLALVSGQRREDISELQFADLRDGNLHVVQRKTGTRLCIDANVLHIEQAGLNLADVVARCRDNVVSRYMIHHTQSHGIHSPRGSQVWKDTLSRGFKAAIDAAAQRHGWSWDGNPPTFHEIRSLAARLYTDLHGAEFAQLLLGHKDPRMTAIYRDTRGHDWVMVTTKSG